MLQTKVLKHTANKMLKHAADKSVKNRACADDRGDWRHGTY